MATAASASRLTESAALFRLGATQARHLHTSLARRAHLINPSTSVDPLLGVSVPAPPRPGEESGLVVTGNARPNNPNDLSQLLKTHHHRSGPPDGARGGQAPTRARSAAAMGAVRRGGIFGGSEIPTQNLELEGAFSPPDAPIDPTEEARKSMAKRGEEAVDRETPHPVDAMNGRNELDERVLAAARAVHARGSTNLSVLLNQFEDRAGAQLPIELPYESTPGPERRVRVTGADSTEAELHANHDDGVLLIAYVAGLTGQRGTERISVCSGFAVEGGQQLAAAQSHDNKGALVISCAHTVSGCQMSRSYSDFALSLLLRLPTASSFSACSRQACVVVSQCKVDCGRLSGAGDYTARAHLSSQAIAVIAPPLRSGLAATVR